MRLKLRRLAPVFSDGAVVSSVVDCFFKQFAIFFKTCEGFLQPEVGLIEASEAGEVRELSEEAFLDKSSRANG